MTETQVADIIEITPALKAELRELHGIYKLLTDETLLRARWPNLAEAGIHPVYVGEGENRKLRGVRLGTRATPAESGSVCLHAMIHTNEPSGLAGLQSALHWWDELSKAQKDAVPGDVYLLFTGEHQQADKYFERILNGPDTIRLEEATVFRKTSDGKTDRNRLPFEEPGDSAAASAKALWRDHQELESTVFSKCGTPKEGENPGFIIGFHSLTLPGPVTALISLEPVPNGPEKPGIVSRITDYVKPLSAMCGAELIVVETHNDVHNPFFESCLKRNAEPGKESITTGTVIPLTLECGRHLDPKSIQAAKNAAMNALEYKFGPELVRGAERPQSRTVDITYNTQVWSPPASPDAERNNPKKNKEFLAPPLRTGEAYGTIHFIKGMAITDAEKLSKDIAKPSWLSHLSDREWEMVRDTPATWKAVSNAKPNQLGNGAKLAEGQPFALVDIKDATGTTVRFDLLRAPVAGICLMFSRDPVPCAAPGDYVLICECNQATVELPAQANMGNGAWTKDRKRLSADVIAASGQTRPHTPHRLG